MLRKTFMSLVLPAVLATAATGSAAVYAGDYPDHAVTVVVPFGAGGSADVHTREVTEKLRQKLRQPFVIENRVGAGGVVGTSYAARAKPDGYTLLTTGNAQLISEPLRSNKPYEFLRDFVPVAPISEADLVLVVNGNIKARTVDGLVALLKSAGDAMNYSSAGIGTPYHLAGELFKSMTGVEVMHVPYKSSGEARTAVLAGEVAYMFDSVATMASHIRDGKVHAIATTGSKRSTILPDVPTLDEAGLKGYRATILVGLVAPKGTPSAITEKLNQEVREVLRSQEIKTSWAKQGVEPLIMNTVEFRNYLQGEVDKYTKIVKDAKIPSL